MTSDTTKSYSAQPVGEHSHHLFDNWFDPIESALRERAREFIEELILGEFDAALGRPRYGRRARLDTPDGKTTEWHSKTLRAYQRRTLAADALIAGAYLAGTNTRRVRRALMALFGGAVSKDTVSRTWRKVKGD